MGCIYKITGPEEKSYIGVTSKTAHRRFKGHLTDALAGHHSCNALARAIVKHGPEVFTVKTLVIANDWDYLNELEAKAIIAFNTLMPNGYNLLTGGRRPKWSTESMAKLSKTNKDRYERGESFPKEHRDKISKKLTGRRLSKQHKINTGNGSRGHITSKQTKDKLSIKMKERNATPEWKANWKLKNIGRKRSAEFSVKLSELHTYRREFKNERLGFY